VPTRERLLDATEALMAEHGTASVSVRDVLRVAGVANASAINYYFGGKESLVAAVGRRAVDHINRERLAGLQALGSAPAAEGLVRAWVEPVARLRGERPGRFTAQVFAKIFDEPRERWEHNGAAETLAVTDRFIEASGHLLPSASHPELLFRWQSITAIVSWYIEGYLDVFAEPSPDQIDADVDAMVAQGVAVLDVALTRPGLRRKDPA
jgi:AcrR family transcriptional regulator